MAEIAVTVEVGSIDFATEAANSLGLSLEAFRVHWATTEMRLTGTTEHYSSIPRLLGDFWTEYADVLDSYNHSSQRER